MSEKNQAILDKNFEKIQLIAKSCTNFAYNYMIHLNNLENACVKTNNTHSLYVLSYRVYSILLKRDLAEKTSFCH